MFGASVLLPFLFYVLIPFAGVWTLITNRFFDIPIAALPEHDGSGQTAIVTGSNTGIGFQTARLLTLEYNFTTIIASRNDKKALAAANSINEECDGIPSCGGEAFFVSPLDLSSFPSVLNFVETFAASEHGRKVDVLVNNAGISGDRNTLNTEDDLDHVIKTNFLGHMLLTNLLLPSLAAGGRVVNLSSVMQYFVGDRLSNMKNTNAWDAVILKGKSKPNSASYAWSKVMMRIWAEELANGTAENVTFVSANPGGVYSEIWRSLPQWMKRILEVSLLDCVQGAWTSVAAAIGDVPSGSYLEPYLLPRFPGSKTFQPLFEISGPFVGWHTVDGRVGEGGIGAAMMEASNKILTKEVEKVCAVQ